LHLTLKYSYYECFLIVFSHMQLIDLQCILDDGIFTILFIYSILGQTSYKIGHYCQNTSTDR
jgi:hypothetical protein